MIRKTLIAMTATALAASLAFAGSHDGRGNHQRQERMKKLAEELQLSSAQMDALREMRRADMEKNRALREQAQSLAKEYVALRDKNDPRADKVRTQLKDMREDMEIRKLANRDRFETILTPEQKGKLEQLKLQRGQRHGQNAPADAAPEK
jgi:Spy/CpxP family protein refolding chaperone